ncbi:hypothetical protein LTR53_005975 [Teratosphaeriaceae sp. CCFEE 6253]|nr:hypothetical protein LTR53_005975 [Teratosphaeriaceae sp. CCFEE 6253]
MLAAEQKYAELLESQKALLLNAQRRKGQKPTGKPDRAALKVDFAWKADFMPAGHRMRTSFIGEAHPPSTTPVADLKPMLISDLLLETHHTGRVLILRTFAHPRRLQSVQNGVEDEDGNVDRLAVYNTDPGIAHERILPRDAIIAVKEPFYKATADGGYTIRVDHPSDLVRLSGTDDLVPPRLAPGLTELDIKASKIKAQGNDAYVKKDYLTAIERYTAALLACSDTEEMLRYDLHRNRAIVNLLLDRFEPALADAQAAIITSNGEGDTSVAKLNGKAYYRAACAAYGLRDFRQAQAYCQEIERCTPGDEDAARQLTRTARRIEEAETGRYDFTAMSDATSTKHNRLDHADFTAKTEVRDAGKRGKGLFAVSDIRAGELVLCEKAFSIAFASDEGTDTHIMVNVNTQRGSMGPHATLLFDLVRKMSHGPTDAARYFELYDGGYTPKIPPQLIDGNTVIDTFRTASIVEYNGFACSAVRSSDFAGMRRVDAEREQNPAFGSTGVWVVASRVNHACDGNAVRAFIGDMMIVHACRDIQAGEEITMAYCSPETDSVATRAHTKKVWGFECDCRICKMDAGTSKAQRDGRRALLGEAKVFLAAHEASAGSLPSSPTRAKAENLRAGLEATYDEARFAGKPRLALMGLSLWLCQTSNPRSPRSVADGAERLLRDLGYGVAVKGSKLTIDRTCGHFGPTVVDAAMYAAQAYHAQGHRELGRQYEAFAREAWMVLYAEMRGFTHRFGSS